MTLKHNVEDHDLHFTVDPVTRKIDSKTSGKACLMQYDHNSEVITFSLPVTIEGHCMPMADSIQVHYSNESKGTSAALRKTYRGITDITSTVEGPSDITYAGTTWKFNTHPFANRDILALFDTDVFSMPVHFKMVDSDTTYDEMIFRRIKNSDGEWDYSITYKSSDESVLAYDSKLASWGPEDILNIFIDYRSIIFLDEPSFTYNADKAYAWFHMIANATLVDPVDSIPTFAVSWTVPENATMFAGALKFQLKFICHEDEEKHFEGYKWHTDVNEDISILPGLPNTEEDLPPSVTATLHSLEINEVKEGLEVILDGKTYRIYHGGYSDTVMDTVELKKNKVFLIDDSSTHSQYPTAAAVRDFLNKYADEIKEDLQELNNTVEFKANRVETINENSTDLQYPSAKAVYLLVEQCSEGVETNASAVETLNKTIEDQAKTINEQADTIEELATTLEEKVAIIESYEQKLQKISPFHALQLDEYYGVYGWYRIEEVGIPYRIISPNKAWGISVSYMAAPSYNESGKSNKTLTLVSPTNYEGAYEEVKILSYEGISWGYNTDSKIEVKYQIGDQEPITISKGLTEDEDYITDVRIYFTGKITHCAKENLTPWLT